MIHKLSEDFPAEKNSYSPDHAEFFERLTILIGDRQPDNELGSEIEKLVMEYITAHRLEITPDTSGGYKRTYIGRDERTGWEAIVMSWKKGDTTAIHSHPQFASYAFADGDFNVEIFDPVGEGKVKKVQELQSGSPKFLFSASPQPGYENHIHRITCLSDTGHSLHIYSDDALKGNKYEPA